MCRRLRFLGLFDKTEGIQVLGFGAVLGEVVEGPGAPAFANDLVLALDDGVGAAVVEDVGMVAVDGLVF